MIRLVPADRRATVTQTGLVHLFQGQIQALFKHFQCPFLKLFPGPYTTVNYKVLINK